MCMSKRIIFVSRGAVKTSRGWVAFAWSEDGLYANTFFHRTKAEAMTELVRSLDETPFEIEQADFEKEKDAPKWIGGYFVAFADGDFKNAARILKGEARFDAGNATGHQVKVWSKLTDIPWGKTKTYGELAREIGSAPRAVGGACGTNRCPMIIPCHRVVGANGSLTGFGGGLELKSDLLAREGFGS